MTAPATMAEVIRAKRDGAALGEEDIGRLIAGIVDGSVSDAQVAAFAMAVYFRGMSLRHGDRRVDPADHRVDPLEEARRRARRMGFASAT